MSCFCSDVFCRWTSLLFYCFFCLSVIFITSFFSFLFSFILLFPICSSHLSLALFLCFVPRSCLSSPSNHIFPLPPPLPFPPSLLESNRAPSQPEYICPHNSSSVLSFWHPFDLFLLLWSPTSVPKPGRCPSLCPPWPGPCPSVQPICPTELETTRGDRGRGPDLWHLLFPGRSWEVKPSSKACFASCSCVYIWKPV